MVVIQNRLASRAEAKWVILAQESGFSKNLMLKQPQFFQLWCVYLLWSSWAEFVLPSDCSVRNFQKSSMVRLARYKAKEFFWMVEIKMARNIFEKYISGNPKLYENYKFDL